MDLETKEALAAGASLLIKSPNAHHLMSMVTDCAPLMARYKELVFAGESSDLYVLARMKMAKPDVFDSVMRLVEQRRADLGYDKLESDSLDNRFDRTQYMQEFMVQKRLRQRRAADIENMRRPERDKLVGRSRLDYMQRVAADWKTERDALLAKVRSANGGDRLRKEDMQAILHQFWVGIDAQLDAQEDAARRGTTVKKTDVSLHDLNAALVFDPYKK